MTRPGRSAQPRKRRLSSSAAGSWAPVPHTTSPAPASRDIVLLEANELASGSSGKPLGGVRAQFSDPANIELGARSLIAFHRFNDDFGVDIGYQQVGYLFLIRDDADVARYQASIELQETPSVWTAA